ncbi:porin family protein [Salinimonas sediminis]|uniref:Porin n=1 Tax=Salinimonas sediminis TaxID=2303538 RepID=A0A346NR97_9ALTE|nr:porin [Salinimonas sediminis]AXR08054.1 porin [Salinimonas sediminis]
MKFKNLSCLSMGLALSFNAVADVQLSGFGTLAAGLPTDSDKEIRNYSDGEVDFKNGSFFALQAYADLNDGLSATAQIRARGIEDWDPEFTWAYLSYEMQDNWRVQVGRQRIPIYLYSDYLDVSYAYHWIAPPMEVYQSFFDSIDGISSIHDFTFGDAMLNLRFYYGQENTTRADGIEFDVDKVFSAVASVNYGWWTFRSTYVSFELTSDIGLNPLSSAWGQTPFAYVGDDLEINQDTLTGMEFGVIFDNQDWLFVAEYIPASLDHTLIGDFEPWMVSLGKRFGPVLVHGTYGHDKAETGVDLSAVPVGVDANIDALYTVTEQVIAERTRNAPFYTLGARWDFHESAAFKAEYTNTEQADGSNAGLFQVALVTVF